MRQSSGSYPVIGITGGVGAGKSTVLDYLKSRGAFVIEADKVAKELMEPGSKILAQIAAAFGEELLLADGSLDREGLAGLVFSDEEKLLRLNALTHPEVKRRIRAQAKEACRERLVFVEAALLIEDHYEEICDCFWYIYAEESIRRARLKSSRGYTDEKISAILRNQLGDKVFRCHCEEIIDNSGSRQETIGQLEELLKRYLPDRKGTGEKE